MSDTSRYGTPRQGDVVVVRQDGPTGDDTFLVRVFRRSTQLLFYTRADAFHDAITFAEIQRVDVWYTADERSYEWSAGFRPTRRPGVATGTSTWASGSR